METKERIFEYLNGHHTAVVATLSSQFSNQPMAATIVPKFRADFTCLFSTSVLSRKYANLTTNPKVALVAGFEHDDPYTLQYEGLARGIEKGQPEYLSLLQELEEYRPELGKYIHLPQNAFVEIKPVWVLFSKTDVIPAETTELKF